VERLATVPRVVADEQPIDVSGFEMAGEERERLQAQRSARIQAGTINPFNDPKFWVECVVRGGVVFCPVVAGVAGAGVLAYNAGQMAVGAVKDDTYIPPEGIGVRLAAAFNDHVRSMNLRDEVAKRIPQAPSDRPEIPSLVLRIESARLVPVPGGVVFAITARSQAISASGKKGSPVTHRITSRRRKSDEWLASDGKLFREDLDAAIEALGSDVISIYMPEQLTAPGD
jgi:hypothetical protein